jgi:hypothetical protein
MGPRHSFLLFSSTSSTIVRWFANSEVNFILTGKWNFLFLDQDLPGIAHSLGLLRLPIMKELRGRNDMSSFENAGVNTAEIPFKNAEKEAARQDQSKKGVVKQNRKRKASS